MQLGYFTYAIGCMSLCGQYRQGNSGSTFEFKFGIVGVVFESSLGELQVSLLVVAKDQTLIVGRELLGYAFCLAEFTQEPAFAVKVGLRSQKCLGRLQRRV